MLKVPTPNSNLNLVTFTFHYINPTNAQQMHFSPVNKTVSPLECAALTCKIEWPLFDVVEKGDKKRD
jgi:hypothetical protein